MQLGGLAQRRKAGSVGGAQHRLACDFFDEPDFLGAERIRPGGRGDLETPPRSFQESEQGFLDSVDSRLKLLQAVAAGSIGGKQVLDQATAPRDLCRLFGGQLARLDLQLVNDVLAKHRRRLDQSADRINERIPRNDIEGATFLARRRLDEVWIAAEDFELSIQESPRDVLDPV